MEIWGALYIDKSLTVFSMLKLSQTGTTKCQGEISRERSGHMVHYDDEVGPDDRD